MLMMPAAVLSIEVRLPKEHLLVGTTARELLAVVGKRAGGHGPLVALQRVDEPALQQVVRFEGAVVRAGQEVVAARVESEVVDGLAVRWKTLASSKVNITYPYFSLRCAQLTVIMLQQLVHAYVPDLHSRVGASDTDAGAAGVELDM